MLWMLGLKAKAIQTICLPLPPVAGEVAFQDVDFRFNESAPLVS